MDGSCYIIGAGEFFGFVRKPGAGDYVIAADAGYKYCLNEGVTPDLVVGDFDSLGARPVPEYSPDAVERTTQTSLTPCASGWSAAISALRFTAAPGGLQSRPHAVKSAVPAVPCEERRPRHPVRKRRLIHRHTQRSAEFFSRKPRRFFPSSGVLTAIAPAYTREGFKYSSHNAVVTSDFPIGVSNSFTGKPAKYPSPTAQHYFIIRYKGKNVHRMTLENAI